MNIPDYIQENVLLRDRNTNVVVCVVDPDAPNPQIGNPARGFKWVNTTNEPGDRDHTGFCPHTSAGCFEPVEKTRREKLAAAMPTFARMLAKKPTPRSEVFSEGDEEELGWPDDDDSPETRERKARLARQVRELNAKCFYPVVPYPPTPGVAQYLVPRATREQELAATIAGGILGVKRASTGNAFFDETDLAADALATAREIISQSENPTGENKT